KMSPTCPDRVVTCFVLGHVQDYRKGHEFLLAISKNRKAHTPAAGLPCPGESIYIVRAAAWFARRPAFCRSRKKSGFPKALHLPAPAQQASEPRWLHLAPSLRILPHPARCRKHPAD